MNQFKTQSQSTRLYSLMSLFFLVFFFAMACDELPELKSEQSLNQGYTLFGIRAEPPIVRPDDKVVITAYDHHPQLNDVAYSWSLCLYSHGASANFECLNDELLLPLSDTHPRIVIDLSEKDIQLRTRLKALGQALDYKGQRRSLKDGLDLFIILKSGDPSKGLVRSVKRLHVVDAEGTEALASNPKLEQWTLSESEVTNRLPNCVAQPKGTESSIQYNELGELVNGTLRSSVIDEIRGEVMMSKNDNMPEDKQVCVFHNQALLSLSLDPKGAYDQNWSVQEGYTYRWYASIDQQVLNPVSIGGPATGRFKLNIQGRSLELFFTVRDPDGGFTMGRQRLNLVPGISTRN